jgi:mannose-6-phosphate isomerase-like protein (cupin superfamily)
MAFDYRVERWKQPYPPNPAMLRLELVGEGYDVFQWADRPNTGYGSHKHPQAQSHWVISGNLEIVVERVGRFVLGPGDRDFMPADTYHTARVLGIEPVVYLVGELNTLPASTEQPKPKRVRKPKAPATVAAKKPRKKRMTKAEKAAADAEFEALKRIFENF